MAPNPIFLFAFPTDTRSAIGTIAHSIIFYKVAEYGRRDVGISCICCSNFSRSVPERISLLQVRALEYAERAWQSLNESRVPEAITAQALVNVIKAALTNDKLAEAQALLVCAKSPANTGDLKESLEFALETQAIAQAENLTSIELEATKIIEEYNFH